MSFDATVSLITLAITVVIAILFFIWQKNVAEDLLNEKGYFDKKIGFLLFFMPLICWVYVCALPNKNKSE